MRPQSAGAPPADFVFQLSRADRDEVVANCDHLQRIKFSRTMPLTFTEHMALMAASILNTPRAVAKARFSAVALSAGA